jgi:hypothetical protein
MENEMKPTEFLSLPQELQCLILAFLPWRDILRLTSVSDWITIDGDSRWTFIST